MKHPCRAGSMLVMWNQTGAMQACSHLNQFMIHLMLFLLAEWIILKVQGLWLRLCLLMSHIHLFGMLKTQVMHLRFENSLPQGRNLVHSVRVLALSHSSSQMWPRFAWLNLCCNIICCDIFLSTSCRPVPNRCFHRAMLVQNPSQTCRSVYQASNGYISSGNCFCHFTASTFHVTRQFSLLFFPVEMSKTWRSTLWGPSVLAYHPCERFSGDKH